MHIKQVLKYLKVLYLEDDDAIRNHVKNTLAYFIDNVMAASSAEEALVLYTENKPDLIITDIDMQGMNGLEFVKKVREQENFIPIIIITAYKTENFLLEALTLQIDNYIIKPVTLDVLVKAVETAAQRILELNRFIIHFPTGYHYHVTSELFTSPNGKPQKLANKEKQLFNLLLENKNTLTTYDMIQEYVWNDSIVSKGNLKLIINKLRTLIGKDTIVNEVQMGYKLLL